MFISKSISLSFLLMIFLLSLSPSATNADDSNLDKLMNKFISASAASMLSSTAQSLSASPPFRAPSSSSASSRPRVSTRPRASSRPRVSSTVSASPKSKLFAERRKAVTIGLNRWIRPLTIQVPDVISNLLPSSSNIIKVHDDSPKNMTDKANDTKNGETSNVNNNDNNKNNQNPFYLNYDPMKLLNDFDQQPNLFAQPSYPSYNGLNPMSSKFLPNSAPYMDEGTIGEMQNAMIPLNIMPAPMINNMIPLQHSPKQQRHQHVPSSHYMDYADHTHSHNYHHNHRLPDNVLSHQSTNAKPKFLTKPINHQQMTATSPIKNSQNFANFESMESITGGKNRYVDNYTPTADANNDNDIETSKFQDSPMKIESNFMSAPIQTPSWNNNEEMKMNDMNFGKPSSSINHLEQSEKSNDKLSDEKMNYYKKLFESFDDDSTNSFGDLFSSPKSKQMSAKNNHQLESLEESSFMQSNPQSSNSQQEYFHQSSLNDDNHSGSSESVSQQQSSHPDSMMEQYYGKNENKYLTAASEIEPIIVKGPKALSSNSVTDEQTSKMNIPTFRLPLMVHESYPDHHLSTNHPRPVTSRFKEFFKNLMNNKS